MNEVKILVEITYILCGILILFGTFAYCLGVFTVGEFVAIFSFGIIIPVIQTMIAMEGDK